MRLIHILGGAGSGTTTLGNALAKAWGWTHLDTDDYFWVTSDIPFTVIREKADRRVLLRADVEKSDRCVLSGSLCGWGDFLIDRFELVIRMSTPCAVRIQRLKEREKKLFGDRILPGGDMYDAHQTFLKWAGTYDTADVDSRSVALHEQWIAGLTCPVLRLDGTQPVSVLLKAVEFAMDEAETHIE